ncbi:Alpha/Beta hydrolase protein [Aspergillus ambiguus]|uniref:Alpha/Beta hydrolase protein n=1 Tax=Aspergillus ambiguus TaxID=176160 RepID=UPI003CCE1690
MWRITLFFRKIYLRITVTLLRSLFKLARPEIAAKNVHAALRVPSRDASRNITAHLYTRDTSPSRPQPVLINFHGSGMIFPAFGDDDEFCHRISQSTDHAVIDVKYRLSPEKPFPAAINDVEDVVRWIMAQPEKYDLTRLSISGFSAGGNLAIVAAAVLFPKDTFHSVLTFYPGTDLASDPAGKIAPDNCGRLIPPWIASFFHRCYIPVGVDARDPQISPLFADFSNFPSKLLVVTAARDNMAPEAEEFAMRVKKQTGHEPVLQRMEQCEHGWDKYPEGGPVQEEAKRRAYSMAVDMLKDSCLSGLYQSWFT